MDYNITINNYFVTITFPKGSVVAPITVKNVEGEVQKGFNLIKNLNGTIYVEGTNP
jgi:hypothetical protein